MFDSCRKCDFINACTKFNTGAEEFRKFRTISISAVGKSHAGWHQAEACQLSAHTDQRRHKKLDLDPDVG
jgi:hypothetical protein